MPNTTSRLSLQEPLGADSPSVLRTSVTTNATTLDNSVLITEDVLANRPAVGSVEHNRMFHATDVDQWFIADGATSTWNTLLIEGAWQLASAQPGFNAGNLSPTTAQFRLVGDRVEFKGLIGAVANVSQGSTLWTMPVAYRPAAAGNMPVAFFSGSFGGNIFTVNTNGTVTTAGLANGYVVYIEGCSYALS